MPQREGRHRSMLPDKDSDTWQGHTQRYECGVRYCQNTVLLPEHPTEGPVVVKAACVQHGYVEHVADGRVREVGRPLMGYSVDDNDDEESDTDTDTGEHPPQGTTDDDVPVRNVGGDD